MIPYGMNKKEYGNDSKKFGDLYSGKRPHSRLLDKIYLRSHKKRARRDERDEIKKELDEI